jgi:uncharacterized membrane protein YGL010W
MVNRKQARSGSVFVMLIIMTVAVLFLGPFIASLPSSLKISPGQEKVLPIETGTLTDVDGNVHKTVKIGAH